MQYQKISGLLHHSPGILLLLCLNICIVQCSVLHSVLPRINLKNDLG